MVNSLRPRNLCPPGAFLLLVCIGRYKPTAGACSDAHQCLGCPHCPDRALRRHSAPAISPSYGMRGQRPQCRAGTRGDNLHTRPWRYGPAYRLALGVIAAFGCGLALAEGHFLFVGIFAAASAAMVIEAMRRSRRESGAKN